MRRRRHRDRITEDDQETDRWLISYADFITLLFAFFVVMYSISQVSETKYKILSKSISQAFDTPIKSLTPIQIGDINRSIQDTKESDEKEKVIQSDDADDFTSVDEFKNLQKDLEESLSELIKQDLAEISSDVNWININLQSGLLFPSGSDNLNNGADPLLSEVAVHLNKNRQLILVHGHTDNIPINTTKFPSNWELSSSRAVAVVRKLQKLSVLPARMSVEGHGEFQPIASNNNVEGRAKNRRVVISISRKQAISKDLVESTAIKDENKTTNAVNSADINNTKIEKDKEPEFEIVRLPSGGIIIRGKDLPSDSDN